MPIHPNAHHHSPAPLRSSRAQEQPGAMQGGATQYGTTGTGMLPTTGAAGMGSSPVGMKGGDKDARRMEEGINEASLLGPAAQTGCQAALADLCPWHCCTLS
jgi:hypothetical protein